MHWEPEIEQTPGRHEFQGRETVIVAWCRTAELEQAAWFGRGSMCPPAPGGGQARARLALDHGLFFSSPVLTILSLRLYAHKCHGVNAITFACVCRRGLEVGISRFIYVWRLLELVWARAKKADQDDFVRLPVFCPRRSWASREGS